MDDIPLEVRVEHSLLLTEVMIIIQPPFATMLQGLPHYKHGVGYPVSGHLVGCSNS